MPVGTETQTVTDLKNAVVGLPAEQKVYVAAKHLRVVGIIAPEGTPDERPVAVEIGALRAAVEKTEAAAVETVTAIQPGEAVGEDVLEIDE